MIGKLWDTREEEIICEIYLENEDCSKEVAEIASKKLVEEGFEERSISSIQAKLRDYDKIHKRKNISHCAPKSINVYKKKVKKEIDKFGGLDDFMLGIYGKKSPILDYDYEFDLVDDSPNNLILNSIPNTTGFFTVNGFNKPKNFIDYFMELCIKSGKEDRKIYNPSGKNGGELIDRRVFSKMKQGQSLSKGNLIKFAICLELDYDTTVELLAMANCAFNPGLKKDVIIMYAIQHHIYDPEEIDDTLYYYGEDTLFV